MMKRLALLLAFAHLVATHVSDDKSKVIFDIPEDVQGLGYAPTVHMFLSSKKLKSLGWQLRYQWHKLCKTSRIYPRGRLMKKEIIIVTISLGNDGAERILTELARQWVHDGHHITVIQTSLIVMVMNML